MAKLHRSIIVVLVLIMALSCSFALRSNNILQDNKVSVPKVANTTEPAGSLSAKKQEPGVIHTPGVNKKLSQPVWAYTNYIDWTKMKTYVHSQREIILYSSSIAILTAVLLVSIKVIKSKYYTNKFNEKDLFNARSLFKAKGRLSHEKRRKEDEGLKTILEDVDESCDVENGNKRETCKTIYEDRFSHTYSTFSVPGRNSHLHVDGERLQHNLRRNYHERKTGEEPEIISVFSTEKSEDYAIPQRQFMKADFGNDKLEKAAYLKAKERALFGNFNSQNDNASKLPAQEGVKSQIKIDFSESGSEDEELSDCPRQDDINNVYGRDTIDLNGPMYDPMILKKNGKGCMSEFSQAESEANDMNKILNHMEEKPFKGFEEDDITNSVDSRINEGAMLRSRHHNNDMEDLFF
ncbi:unnamed protein product [Moneuplotes crassus]|uniref:Uncharacterized protein n=1 Tax=Euplotes crassus TaxID=5936 RepID=A0AAD1UM94_EUPCR|nr:unnamed protein product [Moneuplotes crassus]